MNRLFILLAGAVFIGVTAFVTPSNYNVPMLLDTETYTPTVTETATSTATATVTLTPVPSSTFTPVPPSATATLPVGVTSDDELSIFYLLTGLGPIASFYFGLAMVFVFAGVLLYTFAGRRRR